MTNLKNDLEATDKREKVLGDLLNLLKRKNIDIADIGDVSRVSIYQSLTKNEEGEAEVHDLAAIQFSPTWDSGPKWPVVQQGPNYKLAFKKASTKQKTKFGKCVIVPDAQIGYYRGRDGKLEPTHDEKAIQIVIELIREVKPSTVVCVGDNLDLPEMGKYLTTPAYQQTTQAAIDRATALCAQLREAAPNAEIVWLAGNHEERMPKYLLTNAAAAYGLRKGNIPDSWPVLTIPYLCRMEEYLSLIHI